MTIAEEGPGSVAGTTTVESHWERETTESVHRGHLPVEARVYRSGQDEKHFEVLAQKPVVCVLALTTRSAPYLCASSAPDPSES